MNEEPTRPPAKAALYEAAEVLGGQDALARVLGLKDKRNVSPWFTTDRDFPAEHCLVIERATRERGQVVVCERLRPDIPWAVVRGSPAIESEAA